jgi:Mn2+/Fe2+ NRAMP family transporter
MVAGIDGGYQLIWALMFAIGLGYIFQCLAMRLGIFSGKLNFFQIEKANYNNFFNQDMIWHVCVICISIRILICYYGS